MNLKEKLASVEQEEIKTSERKECLVEEAVLDMYENMCQFVSDLDLDNEDIKDRIETKSIRSSDTTEHIINISANTKDFSSLPNYLFGSDNYVNLLKIVTSLIVYNSIVNYAAEKKYVSEAELHEFKADNVALRTATNALLVEPITKDVSYLFTLNDFWCKENERLLAFKDDLFDEGELFVDSISIHRKKGSDVVDFRIVVKMAYHVVVKTKEDDSEDAGCDCGCHCGGHCFDRESRAIDDLKKILKGRGIDLDEVKVRKIDLNDPDDAKMVDKILDNLFN